MKFTNCVFFDLETTGTDTDNDRICSLKMVGFDAEGNREDKYILVNPEISIPAEATAVHGITNEMVKDKPTFKQYAKAIYKFIKKYKAMIGFNSNKFDVPMLWVEFDRAGIEVDIFEPDLEFIDVRNIHVIFNPTDLGYLYKLYTGEDLEGAHDANNDVEATIKVLECISLKHNLNVSDISNLALNSNFGEERNSDVFGKIKRIGEKLSFAFTFGKNKDKDVTLDPSYIDWMIRNNFPKVFIKFLQNILKNGKHIDTVGSYEAEEKLHKENE